MAIEKKTAIILAIVFLLLILIGSLFFGNAVGLPCGNWGTSMHPDVKYQDCTCIGLKTRDALIGGGHIACFGVPVSYSCSHYSESGQKTSISCN